MGVHITGGLASPVRPDGEFVSRRFGKMKAAPTGKVKDRRDDGRTMLLDQPFARRKIYAIENNQCAAGIGAAGQIGRIDSAIKSGPVKGEVGAIFLKLPAKGRGKEGPRCRRIRRGELDIINFVMLGHGVLGQGVLGQGVLGYQLVPDVIIPDLIIPDLIIPDLIIPDVIIPDASGP